MTCLSAKVLAALDEGALLVDNREPPIIDYQFKSHPWRMYLKFGDFMWYDLDNRLVVVERKEWRDLLNSLSQRSVVNKVRVSRLVRQLHTCILHTSVVYLLVEGKGPIPRWSKWKLPSVEALLMRLGYKGIRLLYTTDMTGTAAKLEQLYKISREESVVWPKKLAGMTI